MEVKAHVIDGMYNSLDDEVKGRVDEAIEKIVAAKKLGGKVVVVTGSGPNLHEGVTTLIAELIHKGVVDGVSTSSAVICHEMAGALEKLKIKKLEITSRYLSLNRSKYSEGDKEGVEITVTLSSRAPQGMFSEKLRIHTNSKIQPVIEVPVLATVLGKINVSPRP
ncbi:unnamed protein product [marine sediment metagenome]|uniref:Uncharacterized protein n=1 Tax=marine sediment metagenome TaxID=412755 RepID=X1FND8_9ZZZZ